MKTRLLLTMLGALAVGLSGTAVAQGQGGGGGGGGGGTPTPPDYGDLIILHRNDIGVPILDVNDCQQPIAFPENVGCPIALDCDGDDPCLIPIDADTCGIQQGYATCANEADFGRTNLSRAKEDVLDSQLEDVVVNLAIADCTTLDPAGRMVYSRYVGDELVTGTIDSPLQNLSVYKHLVRDGTIGVPLPQGAEWFEQAARGFGVAMDKAGEVNIDLLVYLNEILGLTEGATQFGNDPVCILVKEEVMGVMDMVEKCFLDYDAYDYDRTSNFSALPSPAYIPEGAATPGWFEFLWQVAPDTFVITEDAIMTAVFANNVGYTGDKIRGFAAAADDTRAVINFMHSHPVADNVATPVPCMPEPDPTDEYDLSISDKSGLKVPKQVIATTEGRELVVTVDNAGPATAAGTLIVTAVPDAGGPVLINGVPGPFFFDFEGIVPGLSYSTGNLYFTIAEPHVATKIHWTAKAVPEAEDPYMSNNEVTATSNVRVTRGGGH